MPAKKEAKDVYKDIYDNYPKDKLLADGRAYLEGSLKLRSRKGSRVFWIAFWSVVVLGLWVAILGIVYILERSNTVANSFEKDRVEKFRKYDVNQ